MYESKNPASAITDGFNTIRINADARTEFIPLTFRSSFSLPEGN